MIARALYSLGWVVMTPLVMAYLLLRSRRQPAYREHWGQRWGHYGPQDRVAAGEVIWIHAVSVGETRAAQPLIRALTLRRPQARILLTHMTPTGRATGLELFGDRVTQAYLPYDMPWTMRRFLRHFRPKAGLIMETELWPNLVAQAQALNVPLALVNARLSERSLRKGLRWSALIRPALRGLQAVLAQTAQDGQRLERLGRDDVVITGNLKFDIEPPAEFIALGHEWRALVGPRPIVLAASTRDGEEALLLQAWRTALAASSKQADAALERATLAAARPLLVLVPRHPQRFAEVARLVADNGLRMVRRSEMVMSPAGGEVDVLLGDSMGEMFAFHALADVSIIGGSLLAFGGQNLIEACAVGTPVIVGPHTYNFAQAAEQSIAADCAIRVTDADSAVVQALRLARDPERRQNMSDNARAFAQAHRGATQKTLAALARML